MLVEDQSGRNVGTIARRPGKIDISSDKLFDKLPARGK